MRKYEAVLCGYYGFGNLGDELLAESIVSLYGKNCVSKNELAILSADPAASTSSLGIRAVDRWNPLAVWRVLLQSRTLILGGGGLFQDSTSVKSCLYYWGVLRMAWAAGCTPWMFGQSVGPFRRMVSELMARNAIGRCVVRVVRDERSMKMLANWGYVASLAPDPVVALTTDTCYRADGGRILVNIRPWGDDSLPRKILSCASRVSETTGLPIDLVAMAPEDEILSKKLILEMGLDHIDIQRIKDLADIRRAWRNAGFAFGMRLHFCILSLIFGLPCLAVPYDPKVSEFCVSHSLPMWNMDSLPDMLSLQEKPSQSMLVAEREEIEEKFGRSFKEVRKLRDRTGERKKT